MKKNEFLMILNKSKNKKKSKIDIFKNKTYISQINSYFRNNNKSNQIHKFNNKTVLNYNKDKKNILNLDNNIFVNYSINKNQKKISNLKNNYGTFITSNTEIKTVRNLSYFKKPYSQNKTKILKKLFPNIEELNLYSNIPLLFFNDYNNKFRRRKKSLKKEIYDYYFKNIKINTNNNFNLLPDKLINNINNKTIRKSCSTYENYIKNMNMIKSKYKFNSNKNTNININVKPFNLKNNKKSFKEFFRNKEINKYFNTHQNFPKILLKNESNYKTLKISKNSSNIQNMISYTISDNNQYDKMPSCYRFSEDYDKIESILSRKKINSYDEIKNTKCENNKYVDKGTSTDNDF